MTTAELVGRFVKVIINPAIGILFAAGFFLFMWGLVQFIINLEEGGDNKEGKNHMLWGIAGMVIMVSIYGILALIDATFSLGALSGQQFNSGNFQNVNLPSGQIR